MTSVKAWPLLLLPLSLVSMGTDCPFPVLNGKIILSSESILKNSFPDNSVAFVECAKGYVRKEGSTSITCLNGVWSAVELICKKIDCGEPTRSPHMSYVISDGTLFGAYIKTICETGYDLEGSSHRQCLVSGWSGKAECILTTCNLPDPIEHGKMSAPRDKPEFNDVITFSCDDNYILVGNSFITCGEYGDYSSPPPKCIAITTPTKESTTTNKATTTDMTTDMTTASSRSHAITTPTKESTTTNKATTTDMTTDMTTASSHSHGGLIEALTTGFMSASAIIAAVLGGISVYRHLKYKGSYNTGEELRTKEELLLNQSV
ncbi:complement decay-accelerating factor-like isoform X4 [Sinocyclocheilus rhinocerous]|uniref:complement decay-accelerating factor-like isoform X3 n=1 Tax=Sinocyclocheilus rhinocerous TaxID=307959 RepID=UPI0007BA6683|nr:PREDICTED: complement decay-accelerating factor-like isoform X3 [Sinocyclocheilus rhinocerous]XP_016367824.1 PREDICTED: complement decay-accelerating factor-like isoform X4 [Sinocyclocheilus rhinocerous]